MDIRNDMWQQDTYIEGVSLTAIYSYINNLVLPLKSKYPCIPILSKALPMYGHMYDLYISIKC